MAREHFSIRSPLPGCIGDQPTMVKRLAGRSQFAKLRVEQLETRVTPSWTGIPPTNVPLPQGAFAITFNSQNDGTGTGLISSNEVDYFTFVAPVTGSYQVSTLTPLSNMDTVLGIFNSSGARIAYNDDISTTNRDSQVTLTLSAGHRYYLGVTNYTGSANGVFTWSVDGQAVASGDDGFENNDTLSTASNLGTLTTAQTTSNLILADGSDWYRFSTTATGTASSSVSIAFQNAAGNIGLELYNLSGQVVGWANGNGNSEAVTLNGRPAGTYYARVVGFNNPAYSLTVTPPVPAAPPSTPTGGFDVVVRASGLSASQQLLFEQAAARWEQIIIGDLPNASYQGVAVDDILIDASAVPIDGAGGTLGQAGPNWLRNGSFLPIHGNMEFDTADLASMEANGLLYSVILHEMGHVLGIGTIWQHRGLLTGAGTTNPRFTGPNAAWAYNLLFGTAVASVPVEGAPSGLGSRDAHWRESIFTNELLSPYIAGSTNPISTVTIASLADMGYMVNLNAANTFNPQVGVAAASSGGGGGTGTPIVLGNPTWNVPLYSTPNLVMDFAKADDDSLPPSGRWLNQAQTIY